MNGWLVLAGWVVFAVFLLASWAKVGEAANTAAALREFGVPAAPAAHLAQWLPRAEAVVALALLLPRVAWAGAIAAALLLALFTAAMVAQLAQGHRPRCNCFGQTRSAPISWYTVARNLLFAALAAALVAAGPQGVDEGLAVHTAALVASAQGGALAFGVLGPAVVLLAWLVLHLARQQGRLLLKIDNLELRLQSLGIAPPAAPAAAGPAARLLLHVGEAAPRFAAATASGTTRTSTELLAESGTSLLVFVGPDCAPCHELMRELASWRRRDHVEVAWVTISAGSAEHNRNAFPNLAPGRLLLQHNFEINDLYGVVATPSALWLAGDGTLASTVAVGRDAIRALFDAPLPEPAAAGTAPAAAPAGHTLPVAP